MDFKETNMKSFKDYLTEGQRRLNRTRNAFLKAGIKWMDALETGNKAQGVAANRKKNALRPVLHGLQDRADLRTMMIGSKRIPSGMGRSMTTQQYIDTAMTLGQAERENKAVQGISTKLFNLRNAAPAKVGVVASKRPNPTLRTSEN